ncbi:MAG: hypothetical protein R3C15_07270 [Thermoleophilia bacterium]
MERVQQGTASCSSVEGRGNVAIATGNSGEAVAGFVGGDEFDKALATGDDSYAGALIGTTTPRPRRPTVARPTSLA